MPDFLLYFLRVCQLPVCVFFCFYSKLQIHLHTKNHINILLRIARYLANNKNQFFQWTLRTKVYLFIWIFTCSSYSSACVNPHPIFGVYFTPYLKTYLMVRKNILPDRVGNPAYKQCRCLPPLAAEKCVACQIRMRVNSANHI